jgi:hypothetical protein
MSERRRWWPWGAWLCLVALSCAETGPRSKAGVGGEEPRPVATVAGSGGDGGGPIIDVTNETGGATSSLSCADHESSVGCDFYSARPPRFPFHATNGACFAAYLVNASDAPVSIRVERAGTPLDVAQFAKIPRGSGASITYDPLPGGVLPPREVAILFLMHSHTSSMTCPSAVGYDHTLTAAELAGTGYDEAFHITTSAPVTAYDIFPYGGGATAITSATLLLPTSAWSTDYVAVSAYPGNAELPSTIQLVATADDTDVTLVPTTDILFGKDVAAASATVPQSYRLRRGQLLQLAATTSGELLGSPVVASKPIGLWGASGCFNVDGSACDSAHQQIPPVSALGQKYVAVSHHDRFPTVPETAPFRIVGAVDGTTLTYDPVAPAGAPTSLNAGQHAEFRSGEGFTVQSQDAEHPFYVAAYMTGCASSELRAAVGESLTDCRGDPEFVNVIPTAQYMRSYVFFTDPTYPETSLAVVRQRGDGGFADVKLDCAGVLDGWRALGTSGEYEYTYVDLVSGNFEPQRGCDNGRHEISSDGHFGLTVWGWGSGITGGFDSPTFSQAVSYAYPAGAALSTLNTVKPVVK